MLLAIDIGNSTISAGLFSGALLRRRLKMPSHPRRDAEEYRKEIERFLASEAGGRELSGIVVSSVVPGLEEVLSHAITGMSVREPFIVGPSLDTGLGFDVEETGQVGPDRIVNAMAAREKYGDPVLAIDFGTATTISAVRNGKFIGGAILPGVGLMSEVLHTSTSRLPQVDIGAAVISLNRRLPAVGKGTTKCIVSGIIYGMAGAVDRLIHEIEREECPFIVVITGGYAALMAPFLERNVLFDQDLTLQGLRLIYERNT
ncbi:MAG TPA: type III pantothenate kinase [Thermodesulfovibrionales bacterium]|nr:type III pantothenate kinase [Thermodesulfovibrionales bacterium]